MILEYTVLQKHTTIHCIYIGNLRRYVNILAMLFYLYPLSFPSALFDFSKPVKRSIFQTFWKEDCCTIFLFFELETSNFGSQDLKSLTQKTNNRCNYVFWKILFLPISYNFLLLSMYLLDNMQDFFSSLHIKW